MAQTVWQNEKGDYRDPRLCEHYSLCGKLHSLYIDKNADYGDSFRKVREEIPNAILVRLSDKLNRLKSLMNGENEYHVKDETIDDTLMDLANYALLELVERWADKGMPVESEEKEEKKKEKKKEERDEGSISDYIKILERWRLLKDEIETDLSGKMLDIRTVVQSKYLESINEYVVETKTFYGGELIGHDSLYYTPEEYRKIFGDEEES